VLQCFNAYQFSLLTWSPYPGVSTMLSLSLTPFSITATKQKSANSVRVDRQKKSFQWDRGGLLLPLPANGHRETDDHHHDNSLYSLQKEQGRRRDARVKERKGRAPRLSISLSQICLLSERGSLLLFSLSFFDPVRVGRTVPS